MPTPPDNGNRNGGPRVNFPAWLNVIMQVGVPSAIALWFVFRVTTSIEDRLARMETIQASVIGQLTQHMQGSEIAIALVRQMCINSAKDDAQQRACLLY